MNNFGKKDNLNISDYFKEPKLLMQSLSKNKVSIISWISLFLAIYIIYAFYSSQDYSFVLTMSSIIQMFGFTLVFIKILGTKSTNGISRNSIISFMICLGSRLLAIFQYDGYLPNDSTGDLIYRLTEFVSFVEAALIYYYISYKYKNQENLQMDTMKWYYFAIPFLFLALLFHPSLDSAFDADVAWTFSLYLESMAMFPQLYLFRKKGGEIDYFTSHYVACSGLSRVVQFVFWLTSYSELNSTESEAQSYSFLPGYVGYFVLISQIGQISLQADYFFYYIKSLNSGVPFTLPVSYEI